MYTRYPFDYFLVYLLSRFQETKHIVREVGTYFPYVFEPHLSYDDVASEMFLQKKALRAERFNRHLGNLRLKYPVVFDEDEAERRGILSAYKEHDEVVNAFKILGGPERRTVELCLLAVTNPVDIRSIVVMQHGIDIDEGVIGEYAHYFFNTNLLMRGDLVDFLELLRPSDGIVYNDVYRIGREALCLHLDIDSDQFDMTVDLRRVYRLAYVQLMRFKDKPLESGRLAQYWMSIFKDAYDRLKAGDDMVKRMIQAMVMFSIGSEKQAFEELDLAMGEMVH